MQQDRDNWLIEELRKDERSEKDETPAPGSNLQDVIVETRREINEAFGAKTPLELQH